MDFQQGVRVEIGYFLFFNPVNIFFDTFYSVF